MLQDPQWVQQQAQGGFGTPTYGYARNNPLKNTDPTGLCSNTYDCCLERNPGNPAVCGGLVGPRPSGLPGVPWKKLLERPVKQFVEDMCTLVSMAKASARECTKHFNACIKVLSPSDCDDCKRSCEKGGSWPWLKPSAGGRYLCDYRDPGKYEHPWD